jgi:hypothetical protein
MNDFDFLIGNWNVTNRRLVQRLVGSDVWEEFPATATSSAVFEGAGNFDEIVFPTKGLAGATLRLLNPTSGEWSLYWASSGDGTLLPPVVGRFENGVGTFFGDDIQDGTPVRVRFIWSRITPSGARWEQAMSVDGEKTWETNWVMGFERV